MPCHAPQAHHAPWRSLVAARLLAAATAAISLVVAGLPSSGTGRAEAPADWQSMFDGSNLGEWKSTPFGGEGEVTAADGVLRIAMGADLSGITWKGAFPRQNFELALEARRVEGSDFFCGLTFPVGESHCSLILGGWGGGVVGLSSIDGEDAANNPTTKVMSFTEGRWYEVRVRVTADRIVCLLDGEPIVDQPLAGHEISVREEVVPSQPLGIATYATTAEVRKLRWRAAARADDPSPP